MALEEDLKICEITWMLCKSLFFKDLENFWKKSGIKLLNEDINLSGVKYFIHIKDVYIFLYTLYIKLLIYENIIVH